MSAIVAPSSKAVTAFNEANARKNLFEGAVRSGKTNTSLLRWATFVRYEAPGGYPLLMAGKTTDTLRQNILNDLETLVGRRNFKFNQKEGSLYGRKILFRGADKQGSESKIRGFTFAGAYLDEKTLLDEEFCRQVGLRMSVEGAKEFATTNPGPPKHWLKLEMDRALAGEFSPAQYRVFHFELADNPSLTREYLDMLEVEYTGLWHDRFVKGLWVAAEGLIYPFFDEATHVIREVPKATRYDVAIDHGVSNATAIGLFGSNAEGCWLEREFYHSGAATGEPMTNGEYVDELDRMLCDWSGLPVQAARNRIGAVVVDPAAATFKVELRRRGYRVKDAHNDVLSGLATVSSHLKSGYFRVHASCENTIREFGAYFWDPAAQERGEDKPLKVDDHTCFVAGTLIRTREGERRIEEVGEGDQVATRSGFRPVLSAGRTAANTAVMVVEFSDGSSLTGTPNHPVYTLNRGFVRMDTLRYHDIVQTWQNPSLSRTKGSSSGAIRTPRTQAIGATIARTLDTSGGVWRRFTERFGKTITGLFPRGTTFTTRTATPSTTTLPTLNACQPSTIFQPTAKTASWPRSTTRGCSRLLRSGTARPRGARGTVKTPSGPGRNASRSDSPVSSAPKRMKRNTEGMLAFARTRARRLGGLLRGWTMNRESAPCAAPPSQSTNIGRFGTARVAVLPRPAGNADVYNLTVAGEHEYFANGVLVHNCDMVRYYLYTLHRIRTCASAGKPAGF